jgi:hypothetical protein
LRLTFTLKGNYVLIYVLMAKQKELKLSKCKQEFFFLSFSQRIKILFDVMLICSFVYFVCKLLRWLGNSTAVLKDIFALLIWRLLRNVDNLGFDFHVQ